MPTDTLEMIAELKSLLKGSYFEECPRDEAGHCKPSGQGEAGISSHASDNSDSSREKPRMPPPEVRNPQWYDFPAEVAELKMRRHVPPELKQYHKTWAASLSETDRATIHYYSDGGFSHLNNALREAKGDPRHLPPEIAVKVKRLTDIIDRAGELPAPTVVYRGIRLDYQEEEKLLRLAEKAAKSEEPLEFLGFSSSSTSPITASDFGDLIFETRVKRGAYVAGASAHGEGELLQRPGSRYRVLGVRQNVPVEGKRSLVAVIRLEEI